MGFFKSRKARNNTLSELSNAAENILGMYSEIWQMNISNKKALDKIKAKLNIKDDEEDESDSSQEYTTSELPEFPDPFETTTYQEQVRICKNYNLNAINTSIPAQKISEAMSNLLLNKKNSPELDISARILLYGPSGAGKTAYVEWLSKNLGMKLHYLRFSDVVNSKVGETETNIKNEFSKAAEENAILFIDECDSLLLDRKGCKESWEISQVNEFLIQLERYPGFLFCATNYADKLDSATDRRFHFKVEFFPNTKEQINLLLKSYFPLYNFTENQLCKICASGSVVPGDFGVLSGRLRFSSPTDLSSDFITDELCDIVKSKRENQSHRFIGFTA